MFQPMPLPRDPALLAAAVEQEFRRLALQMAEPADYAFLKTLYAEPARPRDGMLVKADGTTWNPGSGAGVYVFRGSAWHFLG